MLKIENIYINDKNFKTIKKKNSSYILIFSSNNCPHCKTVIEFFKKFVKAEGNKYQDVSIFIVESEKATKMLSNFNIRSFPTTFFVSEHQLSGAIIGAGSLEEFLSELKIFLKNKDKGLLFKIKNLIKELDK